MSTDMMDERDKQAEQVLRDAIYRAAVMQITKDATPITVKVPVPVVAAR